MGSFDSGESKKSIRILWDLPLLRFLYETINCKLIYLGLPGPRAQDIMDWIDCIGQVIAFQCRDYPKPSQPDQDKKYIYELDKTLRELERQDKIKGGYTLYDGYIEEVLAKGEDNSKVKFSQDSFITLYNLDFCNEITSPQVIEGPNGKEIKFYKLHTVRKLLDFQSKLGKDFDKFIMFLTVSGGFWDDEARNFQDNIESQTIVDYHRKIRDLNKAEKEIRLLKSYIFNALRGYFCDFNFVPEFLPVIKYPGKSINQHLLHFTIIGTKKTSPGASTPSQKQEEFLSHGFVIIKDTKIGVDLIDKIGEKQFKLNPVELLSKSKTFKTLWK